jgi:hypothetical protein
MNRVVFDIEANGLLSDVTAMHCISFKYIDYPNKNMITLSGDQLNRSHILDMFTNLTQIIGHNIIGYDLPLLYKLLGIDLISLLGREVVVDTLILSQVLNPDRELPRGCPTSILNPVTNKSKAIGPHGLEAWGYRVGHKKLEIHDWRVFTPEMIDRCEGDVIINEKVYYALMKEAGIVIDK